MPLPDNWDSWDEIDELLQEFPLRVYRRHGQWVCICARFEREGRCPHLAPFLPREDVDVKEEYL